MTSEEIIEKLRYKANNIKAHIEPEFFNEVADRLEILKELQKRKFTIEDLQEYMKFEDELVRNNFTFNSVLEAREKQVAKKINYVKKYYGSPYQCSICEAEQTKVEFMSTDGSEPKEKHSHCWNCGQKLDWSEVE